MAKNSQISRSRTKDEVDWPATGVLKLHNADIDNQGVFDAQNQATMDVGVGGVAAFINQGTFKKTFGGTTTIKPVFTNTGTFLLNGWSMSFDGGFSQTTAMATTRLGGGTVAVVGGFAINRGVLTGVGTIDGSLRVDRATLDFGTTVGTLIVTGDYDQTLFASMTVKIAGNGAANCDYLHVDGKATLAGFVQVQLVNMYMPVSGTQSSKFFGADGGFLGSLIPPMGWAVALDGNGLKLTF